MAPITHRLYLHPCIRYIMGKLTRHPFHYQQRQYQYMGDGCHSQMLWSQPLRNLYIGTFHGVYVKWRQKTRFEHMHIMAILRIQSTWIRNVYCAYSLMLWTSSGSVCCHTGFGQTPQMIRALSGVANHTALNPVGKIYRYWNSNTLYSPTPHKHGEEYGCHYVTLFTTTLQNVNKSITWTEKGSPHTLSSPHMEIVCVGIIVIGRIAKIVFTPFRCTPSLLLLVPRFLLVLVG